MKSVARAAPSHSVASMIPSITGGVSISTAVSEKGEAEAIAADRARIAVTSITIVVSLRKVVP